MVQIVDMQILAIRSPSEMFMTLHLHESHIGSCRQRIIASENYDFG